MARNYARIKLSINTDEDFENLSPQGQWFFTRIVIPEPSLKHCGVFDWRPNRMLHKAAGLTLPYLLTSALDCEQGRFVLFDTLTEEGLARSYIRSEELLRNPKSAAAVVGAYHATASKILRAAIVTEIRRANKENPDYSSWKSGEVGVQLAAIMGKKAADEVPYVDTITNLITNLIGNPNGNHIGNRDPVPITNLNTNVVPEADYQSDSVRIPFSLEPATITLEPITGGYDSRERHQAANPDPNDPPPKICSRHPNGTDKPCRQCQAIREADEQQHQKQLTAHSQTLKAFWAEVRRCPECDEKGRIDADTGNRVERCPEHDWGLINA